MSSLWHAWKPRLIPQLSGYSSISVMLHFQSVTGMGSRSSPGNSARFCWGPCFYFYHRVLHIRGTEGFFCRMGFCPGREQLGKLHQMSLCVLRGELCVKAHSFFHSLSGKEFLGDLCLPGGVGLSQQLCPTPATWSPELRMLLVGNTARVLPPAVARHYGSCWRDSLPAP